MTRRHFTFECAGDLLAATLDEGAARVGLLIVSGGNEIRSGTFSGHARLAVKIAAAGFPVLRFDRRGVGDSEGSNGGYESAGADIAAAMQAFRTQCPELARIIGFGNCDAATALVLAGGATCDGLILANPWTFDAEEPADALPPPAAIRSRYADKLRNPREWLRLIKGEVDLGKLVRGMKGAAVSSAAPSTLATRFAGELAEYEGSTRILLAGRDRTALAFAARWPKDDPHVSALPHADHAFSGEVAQQWLLDAILAALHEQARQLDMG